MTPKERIDSFYSGKPVDRLPNFTIVGSVITRFNNINLDTYCHDWKAMTEGAVEAAKQLGLDYVQIASDLSREAEGYGSELIFFEDRLPAIKKYAVNNIVEAKSLKPKKVREIPRLYDLVKATEYSHKIEKDIETFTLAVGPATVAGNIYGIENFLMDIFDEPELVKELLEKISYTTLDFIEELAKVGGKYIYVADPVASLLSPSAYEEFILPLHKKIFAKMSAMKIGSRLHMCGNTTKTLPYSTFCGAYVIDVDADTDFQKALEIAQGRCWLAGNISPVSDVYDCSPENTYNRIINCANLAKGAKALFMPGCELPTLTHIENIKMIEKALTDLSKS